MSEKFAVNETTNNKCTTYAVLSDKFTKFEAPCDKTTTYRGKGDGIASYGALSDISAASRLVINVNIILEHLRHVTILFINVHY